MLLKVKQLLQTLLLLLSTFPYLHLTSLHVSWTVHIAKFQIIPCASQCIRHVICAAPVWHDNKWKCFCHSDYCSYAKNAIIYAWVFACMRLGNIKAFQTFCATEKNIVTNCKVILFRAVSCFPIQNKILLKSSNFYANRKINRSRCTAIKWITFVLRCNKMN